MQHSILDIRRDGDNFELMAKDLLHQHRVERSFIFPENTADEN